MHNVRDILRSKGHAIWSVTPESTVHEALQLMADKDVGALLVLEEGKIPGIISERDYARKVILQGRSSLSTPVRAIMTSRIFFVGPEQTLEECMVLMTDKRIRHLPVVEGNKLIGMVSIGDVVKGIIEGQRGLIQQMEDYILGSPVDR